MFRNIFLLCFTNNSTQSFLLELKFGPIDDYLKKFFSIKHMQRAYILIEIIKYHYSLWGHRLHSDLWEIYSGCLCLDTIRWKKTLLTVF
jgi:hypothetical protein